MKPAAMKTLLWWREPVEQAKRTSRSKLFDFVVSFGVSAIVGLGIATQSGALVEMPLGSGSTLSVPAHAWQYGLWLFVCVVGGCGGWWIVSLAGRAEVNLRDDGILEQRRWSARFYPYPHIDRCEIVPANNGAYALLRIHTKRANGSATVRELGISKRVDPDRARDILRSAGVTVTGADA
jgi:hypothetical protein